MTGKARNDGGGDAAASADFEALVAEVRARGAEGLAQLRKAAGDSAIGAAVAEDWETLESRLIEEVRAHPLRALGVAALAGLALGLVIRR